MSPLGDKLKKSLGSSKDYRHGYVDEFLNAYIATQIKVLREQRDWTQQELAEQAGMKQGRISVMENVNYSSFSLNTLRRIAEAFDLTLNVSFEEFGKRLNDIERFSRESLERFSFSEDPAFAGQLALATSSSSALQTLNEFERIQHVEEAAFVAGFESETALIAAAKEGQSRNKVVNLADYRMSKKTLTDLLQEPSTREHGLSALQAAIK